MFLTSVQPPESPVVIFRSGRGVTYERNPSEIHIQPNIHLIQVRAWKTESFHLGWKRGIWGVDFLCFQRTDWSVEEGTLWNTCSPSGCQQCHKEVWWTFQMSTVKGRCLTAWLTRLFSYKETFYFYISGDLNHSRLDGFLYKPPSEADVAAGSRVVTNWIYSRWNRKRFLKCSALSYSQIN